MSFFDAKIKPTETNLVIKENRLELVLPGRLAGDNDSRFQVAFRHCDAEKVGSLSFYCSGHSLRE